MLRCGQTSGLRPARVSFPGAVNKCWQRAGDPSEMLGKGIVSAVTLCLGPHR